MAADINPHADPDRPARCPRRLLGEGPRCLSLVLVRDADEHEQWHDHLDEILTSPVAAADDGVQPAEWPARAPAEITASYAGGLNDDGTPVFG